MTKHLFALAALLVAASATTSAASHVMPVGHLFAASDYPNRYSWDFCTLGDGTGLKITTDFLQPDLAELRLEHRSAGGALISPALVIASGPIAESELYCGDSGEAIVKYRFSNDSCTRYRMVSSDHVHAGDERQAAPNGTCDVSPVFAFWSDGYTMAWGAYHPDAHTDIWAQGFDRDGSERYAPVVLSGDPSRWHSWPVLATDTDGNTLVSWAEGKDEHTDMVAAAIGKDGDPGAPVTFFGGGFDLVGNGPTRAAATNIGSYIVYWPASAAESLLGQHLVIEEIAPQPTTTSTTTSTTLENDVTPMFGDERGWGHGAAVWEIGPQLAGDGHGGWMASWSGSSENAWPFRPQFRYTSVSHDSGRRWSRPVPVGSDVATIVSDGAGEWLSIADAYHYQDVEPYHSHVIEIGRTQGGGSSWSETRAVADLPRDPDEDCSNYISALTLGRNHSDTLLAAWTQSTECDDSDRSTIRYDVYAIRSTDSGQLWSAPKLLYTDYDNVFRRNMSLTATGQDGWVLNVATGTAIRTNDGGVTWTEPEEFGFQDAACDASGYCVSVSDGGDGSHGWDADIFASVSEDEGRTWKPLAAVNDDALIDHSPDYSPRIATDGNGRWTVVWVSHRNLAGKLGFDADLLEAASTDGGRTWSAPRAVSVAAQNDGWTFDDYPVLAYGAGAWIALWQRRTVTENYEAFRSDARVAVADDNCGNEIVDGFDECDDGNTVNGDGCDNNCYVTACGNGIVTEGEECDDGNRLDDDACVADCVSASCGDGYVDSEVEECDDGNSDENDACTSACTIARCGDGFVARGSEECDDGNTSSEDDCLVTCEVARCGDGFILDGVEECDDANSNTSDGCPANCKQARCGDGFLWLGVEACDSGSSSGACPANCGVAGCGDANSDGERTAGDSMSILLHAVGRPNPCPMDQCDVDGNLWISSRDALMTLGLSVGIAYPTRCDLGPWLTVRLQDARTFGALQIHVDTSAAPLWVLSHAPNNSAACESLLTGSLIAGHVGDGQLDLGMIASQGFSGPVDIARCRVEVTGDVRPSQFAVEIPDVTDADGAPVYPPPKVMLRVIAE